MNIFTKRDNTNLKKEFLIPQSDDIENFDWLYIKIDYILNEFFAKKIQTKVEEDDHWVKYYDSTFPSSLFREFLSP